MPADLISIAQAKERVLRGLSRLPAETVDLEDGLDRVLAADLTAAGDVPSFASSAMDGYAVEAGPAGRELVLAGESRAARRRL